MFNNETVIWAWVEETKFLGEEILAKCLVFQLFLSVVLRFYLDEVIFAPKMAQKISQSLAQ